eukprot:sb/3474848/
MLTNFQWKFQKCEQQLYGLQLCASRLFYEGAVGRLDTAYRAHDTGGARGGRAPLGFTKKPGKAPLEITRVVGPALNERPSLRRRSSLTYNRDQFNLVLSKAIQSDPDLPGSSRGKEFCPVNRGARYIGVKYR